MLKVILALATVFGLTSPAGAEKFVNILTGGTSGVYYPLGVAMSKIYSANIPNVRVSVQSTKASAENLNMLQSRRGEIAFSLGDSVSAAWKGDEEAGFRTKLDRLRGVAATYPSFVQIVARGDSDIRSLQDLRGKSISVGAPRSGTELNARVIFRAAGMSYADFGKVEYLPFAESAELVRNRRIDATLQSAALGVASIRDLAAAGPITLVSIPPEVIAAIGNPVYVSGIVPANTYDGQTQDVPTAAIVNYLVTRDGLDEDLVYRMTSTLFANRDALVAAHSAAGGISMEAGPHNMPIPLHPGAEKFYREAGVLK